MRTDHVNCTLTLSTCTHDVSPFFPDFFPDFLIIFALITILGSAHRPCKQYPNIITTIPIFFWFYYYFSCENAKVSIFGIFYLNSGHWIPVPFRWPDSGDHSGVNTGIAQFRGRSEILAGKFHRNPQEWPESNRNRGLISPRFIACFSAMTACRISIKEQCNIYSYSQISILL